MATKPAGIILQHVRKILTAQETEHLSDRDLLRRFAQERDEAAFATLVRRHGPMVLQGCQRVLHNWHDAEDAFQATFLVLARTAASRRWDESVGPWLYLVAHRLALKVKASGERHARQTTGAVQRSSEDPLAVASGRELSGVLDAELSKLPEHYRAPLVLCCLEGLTRDAAARQLGWSVGTLRRRLEQGRALLRQRLVRRGIPLAAILATVLGTAEAMPAALPLGLAHSAVQLATGAALGKAVPGALVSSGAAALADGVLKGMCFSKLKAALAAVLVVCLAGAGAGLAFQRTLATRPPKPRQPQSLGSATQQAGRHPGPDQPQVALDLAGDPLPPEAISRLGTLRLRHGEYTGLVCFTPDGQTLVSQGGDGVRTWEFATGKQLQFLSKETLGGSHLQGVSFSPDGKQVVTANDTGLHVWDLTTASRVRTLGTEGYFLVRSSPNGKLLGAVSSKIPNQVELLEANTGQRLWSWNGVMRPLIDLAFTADGRTVIAAGWSIQQSPPLTDNTIRFLDAATGRAHRRIDLGTRKPERIAPSPDGALLAVIYYSEDGSERQLGVFEVASGKERFRLVQPTAGTHGQRFFSAMTFTPDGKALLTAGGEDSLVLWDLATGKELHRLGRDMTNSSDVTMAPNGQSVAVTRSRIRVIDWVSGTDLLPSVGHGQNVYATGFTPDGQTVLTVSAGPTLIFSDPVTGQERRRVVGDKRNSAYHLVKDGRTAITFHYQEKKLVLWDVATGTERSRLSLDFVGAQPCVQGIAPSGKVLALGSFTGDTLHLIDADTGKVLQSLQHPGRMVRHGEFTTDGRTMVAYCNDHTAHVWDVVTGTKQRQFGPMGEPGCLSARVDGWGEPYTTALSPDGRWIAYGRPDGYLLLFDGTTGQEIHRSDKLPSGPNVFAFSPDSRVLAWGGSRDSVIHLLEMATDKERHFLNGHRGSIQSLTFSADGTTLVSGSTDTTALVWDLTGRLAAKGTWGKPLSPTELDACWTSLAGEDAARAYASLQRLVACPTQALPYLQERLHPVRPADEKRLAGLIADLDSNQFPVRENAARELEKLGKTAVWACRQALAGQPSLELRQRLEALVDKQSQEWRNPPPDLLRTLRAQEVLERMGSPAAQQVLKTLARGTSQARRTEEAKASLERLAKRAAPVP